MPKLIIIEGLDGSGKSTQINLLKDLLEKNGTAVKQIKLPDYEHKSSELIKMYLNGDFGKDAEAVNAYSASLLYAVDRFASFNLYWKEDYQNGTVILADRYATSNAVHQMVKLPQNQWDSFLDWADDLEYVKGGIPRPDLVVYLSMPIEISQRLMTERYNGNEVKKDVHEANVEYLKKCQLTAQYTAKKQNWHVIDCANGDQPKTISDIHNEIFSVVTKELNN